MSAPRPPAGPPPDPSPDADPPHGPGGAAGARDAAASAAGSAGGDEAPDSGDEAGSATRRKPFLLRLPPDLMAELRHWSGQELRSLNGHLEFLLRQAVRQHKRAAKKKDAPES